MTTPLRSSIATYFLEEPLRFLNERENAFGGDPVGVPEKLHESIRQFGEARLKDHDLVDFLLDLSEIDHQDRGKNRLEQFLYRRPVGDKARISDHNLWNSHESQGMRPRRLIAVRQGEEEVMGYYEISCDQTRSRHRRGKRISLTLQIRPEDTPDRILIAAMERFADTKTWGEDPDPDNPIDPIELMAPLIYGYRIERDGESAVVSIDPAERR